MFDLEKEKEKLNYIIERRDEILADIKECYRLDEEQYETLEDIDAAIACEELCLIFCDLRDIEYINTLYYKQRQLIKVLECLSKPDEESKKTGKEALHKLIEEATRARRCLQIDIKKAERNMKELDEILKTCDKIQ